ncbi:transcriptional repressor LexA [Temperatibacter marinus]|uniref:LexA repressor n=1 Tax=Temperatibacter marinus TaxID=1456591 RepID=A0AA52EH20_9PROT|nr:transcriptional repressor LexA [Temperatibacter marinus]WND02374.1 transcriptional repressor LexA [Temperatibacter marinus]
MLTKKQNLLLMFIHEKVQENGVAPSFDEMKDALGLKSKSGIHRLVGALEERGFLRRLANRARALEVVKLPDNMTATAQTPVDKSNIVTGNFGAPHPRATQAPSAVDVAEVPLHGRIAAGTPIEALENADNNIAVPMDMVGRGQTYALTVDGDSMEEMGIMDGDTVLIESCTTAREGDVVVALLDGEEATLKTFKKQNNHIALVPANRRYDTQFYEPRRVQIQGKLVGLMRTYH